MTEPQGTVKIPGHNNATYGPIPKGDQLLQIEFLEIAPSPIPVITLSAVLPDGRREGPKAYTVPLRTTAFADTAHISIRDATGAYVEHLTNNGRNDIVTDYWIPGMFLRTGTWTFEVVARLGDGTCLFALSLTQWLEGELKK
ncbi:hypothetical protein DL765_001117 [Monosporascus sp. GIB2]|nr:hypothetical protein DL765_001117 [Monosporascus sp. GIB2]